MAQCPSHRFPKGPYAGEPVRFSSHRRNRRGYRPRVRRAEDSTGWAAVIEMSSFQKGVRRTGRGGLAGVGLRMEEEPSREGTALMKSRGGESMAQFRKYEQWGWEVTVGSEPSTRAENLCALGALSPLTQDTGWRA